MAADPLDLASPRYHFHIPRGPCIVDEVFLDHIRFVASADHKSPEAPTCVVLHDVSKNGLPADLDHRLWTVRRFLSDAGTEPASKDDYWNICVVDHSVTRFGYQPMQDTGGVRLAAFSGYRRFRPFSLTNLPLLRPSCSLVRIIGAIGAPLGCWRRVSRYSRHAVSGLPLDSWTRQPVGLPLPEETCLMSTMRAYTREFRESAVGLMLTEGVSIRKADGNLGMHYHTLHGWVLAARR